MRRLSILVIVLVSLVFAAPVYAPGPTPPRWGQPWVGWPF